MAYKCIAISDKWKSAVMFAVDVLSKPVAKHGKKIERKSCVCYFLLRSFQEWPNNA